MSELKITTEKVLEAAAKCSQAKETLKTLFPEAFRGEVDLTKWIFSEKVSDDSCLTFVRNENGEQVGMIAKGIAESRDLKRFGSFAFSKQKYKYDILDDPEYLIITPKIKS